MSTSVTVRLLNPWTGERVKRTFAAIGGHVYDTTENHGTYGQQMCRRLAGSGEALDITRNADVATLRRIIEREQRARLSSAVLP